MRTTYLKEIFIIIIIIISLFFWNQWRSTQQTIDNMKNDIKIQETLDKVNSKLKDIEDREKNLYPKINAEINKLNKNISDLEKIKKFFEQNKPKKKDTEDEINKLNVEEISKRFIDLGYSNTIKSSSK